MGSFHENHNEVPMAELSEVPMPQFEILTKDIVIYFQHQHSVRFIAACQKWVPFMVHHALAVSQYIHWSTGNFAKEKIQVSGATK